MLYEIAGFFGAVTGTTIGSPLVWIGAIVGLVNVNSWRSWRTNVLRSAAMVSVLAAMVHIAFFQNGVSASIADAIYSFCGVLILSVFGFFLKTWFLKDLPHKGVE